MQTAILINIEQQLESFVCWLKEIALRLLPSSPPVCTNSDGEGGGFRRRSLWSEVAFEHPATFDTLAMDPHRKEEIIDDLLYFSKSQDYYKKVGKAWKRGYLLHGPPGTGKSTMVTVMVNLLKYDMYDLELTAIKNNTELRKLLVNTTSKSIIMIEDIDCSLDVMAQRERDDGGDGDDDKKEGKDDPVKEKMKKEEKKESKVTLSGLLNTIDGCGRLARRKESSFSRRIMSRNLIKL
ncbi:AAA-ATPase 1 [Perilla frutescens var. hirtella]|nr:AAA-ATPase 1 [Perilla frutescens var. hirtella]